MRSVPPRGSVLVADEHAHSRGFRTRSIEPTRYRVVVLTSCHVEEPTFEAKLRASTLLTLVQPLTGLLTLYSGGRSIAHSQSQPALRTSPKGVPDDLYSRSSLQ